MAHAFCSTILVTVLAEHGVLFDRSVMASLAFDRLLRDRSAIGFVGIDRTLIGTNVLQTFGILNIGRRCHRLINQARLHIHAVMFFVPVPELILTFGAKASLLVSSHLRSGLIIELLQAFGDSPITIISGREF